MIRINRIVKIMAALSLIIGYASCGEDSDPLSPSPEPEPVVLDFQEPVHYPADNHLSEIAASDLDGDGDVDIIVGCSWCVNENALYAFLNNGDGTFLPRRGSPPVLQTLPCSSAFLFAMDFDSDGDDDIIVSDDYMSLIYVLFNNGDMTFSEPTDIISEPLAKYYLGMELVDLDSDGDEDLVVSCLVPTGVFVLLNNGDATFQAPTLVLEEHVDFMAFADLNGEESEDMIGYSDYPPYIITSLGNGDGTFQAAEHHSFLLWDVLAAYIEVCIPTDLDGDGDVELIVGSTSDGAFILQDAGDITYKMAAYYEEPRNIRFGAVADLDNNGYDDFVADSWYSDSVTVFLGAGDTVFRSSRNLYAGFSNFVLSDLDGDGDIDIAGVSFYLFSVMLNTLNDRDQ